MHESVCETLYQETKLVVGEGCYFGIFDSASAVNRAGRWEDEFQAAKWVARNQDWSALFHLNQRWIDLAEEGAILSWITLFDGIFKAQVQILSETPRIEFEKEKQEFLGDGKYNLLYCPSGEIVVDSLTRLGTNSLRPLMKIKPGKYRVGFVRNDDEESRHHFLESESQYPINEGPDWIIYLQRD